ncbi:hypothetical protein ACFX13_035284 [Malus domestica]
MCMALDEEKLTCRNLLYFPIECESPKPGRRPDIFPPFSPMKMSMPPSLPYDPPYATAETGIGVRRAKREDPVEAEGDAKRVSHNLTVGGRDRSGGFLSVLNRDILWETYMITKLITRTCLQLLRRYNKRSESYRSQLLDDDGPTYVQVFVSILRDIFKEETVEYVLALIGIPAYRSGKHRTR